MGLLDRVKALMGLSAYALPPSTLPSLDDSAVKTVREAMGGQLQPIPQSQTRWYLAQLEAAEHAADTGNLAPAARLMRAAKKDGVLSGVLSTRTNGLVRLPRKFRGRPEIIAALELGHEMTRSVFDEMVPLNELALLDEDGIKIGVGIGEMVPVQGRDFPILRRLDPEFLFYRWSEDRWYFRSIAGLIPITPGDGRWVLYTPGGRNTPWQHGLWRALGRAYIRKERAAAHRDNWEGKLANPARVASMPQGATDDQEASWFQQVAAWGVNSVFATKPGYTVDLLESNGLGAKSFKDTIAEQNDEFVIAVAGQSVTVDGGAAFSNTDVFKSIRGDLIAADGDSLAYCINTQILPAFVYDRFGEAALDDGVVMSWETSPPKDRTTEAKSLSEIANAITALRAAGLNISGNVPTVDLEALCAKFVIPVEAGPKKLSANERPRLSLVRETEEAA